MWRSAPGKPLVVRQLTRQHSVAHELCGMRVRHEIGYVNCISAGKDCCRGCGVSLKMKTVYQQGSTFGTVSGREQNMTYFRSEALSGSGPLTFPPLHAFHWLIFSDTRRLSPAEISMEMKMEAVST